MKKYALPLPTCCPRVRDLQRQLFKNERFLYKGICGFTGESTISRFSDREVYTSKVWHNRDIRDQTFIEYDPGSSVEEHIAQLMKETVYIDLIGSSKNVGNNARYVNHASSQNNTYLLYNTRGAEDSAYGLWIKYCSSVFDCSHLAHSEHCYECVASTGLYNCFFVDNAHSCSDLRFCSYMNGCTNCIFSSGLYNKSYVVENTQVTKEEYHAFLETIDMGSYEQLEMQRKKYEEIRDAAVRCAISNIGGEHVIGNQCNDSKDCFFGFELIDCENTRYTSTCLNSQDLMDISSFGEGSVKMYGSSHCGNNDRNIYFSNMTGASENMYYCSETKHCKHCFGCINLYRKEYCIFNKQYTKEEYERILPILFEQLEKEGMWGEFFSSDISPFPYNDTPAIDAYPPRYIVDVSGVKEEYSPGGKGIVTLLDDNEIAAAQLDIGGDEVFAITRRTKRESINIPESMPTMSVEEISDHIHDIDAEDIRHYAIQDTTGDMFRVVSMEIAFYKKHGIALPRLHQDSRYMHRLRMLDKKDLYLRNCDKTGEKILSVYPQGVPFRVYSEAAYRKEMYG